jgi:hypothetical protein
VSEVVLVGFEKKKTPPTTGTPGKNGEMPLGCSGGTTLRREQCGVPPKKLE